MTPLKSRDLTTRHQMAWVDNGHCETCQRGTSSEVEQKNPQQRALTVLSVQPMECGGQAAAKSHGAHTESLQPRVDSSSSSSSEDEVSQAPVPAATTLSASESATAAAASSSDDWCQVCLMALRAGVIFVPCGHARFCKSCAMRVFIFVTKRLSKFMECFYIILLYCATLLIFADIFLTFSQC